MEVEIIKLPTIGKPLSIKTRKQGRMKNIDSIRLDNPMPMNKRKKTKLEKLIAGYHGDSTFIKSVRGQMLTRGFYGLSRKQRAVVEQAFKEMGYDTVGFYEPKQATETKK